MYNILVPVDFSKTSFDALYYAANFAQVIPNAKLTLLHVISGDFTMNEMIAYESILIKETGAKNRLDFFLDEYPEELKLKLPKVPMDREVRFGMPGFTITQYSKENDVDLIIMGTRDRHGIFDRIIGSTSAISLRMASCPVILIHENVRFNIPKKIVYAFDQHSDIEEAISDFKKLNNTLKAKTDFVHVREEDQEDLSEQKSDILEELFDDDKLHFSFDIKSIQGRNVESTLKDYCLFEKADMLAMMHRKEGTFPKLFSRYHSVKMAQDFHLPVIIFHEND